MNEIYDYMYYAANCKTVFSYVIVNDKAPERPANFVLHTVCGKYGFLFSLILIFH